MSEKLDIVDGLLYVNEDIDRVKEMLLVLRDTYFGKSEEYFKGKDDFLRKLTFASNYRKMQVLIGVMIDIIFESEQNLGDTTSEVEQSLVCKSEVNAILAQLGSVVQA